MQLLREEGQENKGSGCLEAGEEEPGSQQREETGKFAPLHKEGGADGQPQQLFAQLPTRGRRE